MTRNKQRTRESTRDLGSVVTKQVSAIQRPHLSVTRLSWAGVKVELADHTLFVDPLEDPALLGGEMSEFVPLAVTTANASVLPTHIHLDHFDPIAARSVVRGRGFVICHESAAPTVASYGIRVRSLRLHETAILGPFKVTPVEAVDGLGAPQVSWVINGGGVRIIHCGDTLWHGQFWAIAARNGPFDLALLPVNGAIVSYTDPPSGIPASMTPEQAAAAAEILGARLAVPIHYGWAEEDYEEVANSAARFVEACGARGVQALIVHQGGRVPLGEPPRG